MLINQKGSYSSSNISVLLFRIILQSFMTQLLPVLRKYFFKDFLLILKYFEEILLDTTCIINHLKVLISILKGLSDSKSWINSKLIDLFSYDSFLCLFSREFTSSFICFPKPLIAAVTGEAVGIGMSILALCDIVYATDKAMFSCPYAKLGQSPEGCLSFLLPQVLGMAKVGF